MDNKLITIFEVLKNSDDKKITEIISDMEKNLDIPFFPQLMILSDPSSKNEIVTHLKELFDLNDDLFENLANLNDDFVLKFKYGEEYLNSESNVPEIFIPWEPLKNMNIFWVCESSFMNIPSRYIIESDKVLMLTNATMAMRQNEKDWLKDVRKSFLPSEFITISLYNKYLLNSDSDLKQLNKSISDSVSKYGKNTCFIDEFKEALCEQFNLIDMEELKENRNKREIKACIIELEKYISHQLEIADIDIDSLCEKIKSISEEQKNIAFSGKIILNGTIENMYSELKNEIIQSADQYSDDAYASIRERLTVSTTIAKDINNIKPYLKSVWMKFENETSKFMNDKQNQFVNVLEEQISSDCKKIVNLLDIKNSNSNLEISPSELLANIVLDDLDESKEKKNKMISKGLLIASIALAFASPIWGLVGIVGTSYFNITNTKNLEEARSKVLSELPNECNEIKRNIEYQIESVIEKNKKESCENIEKLYSDIMDNLMDSIFKYMEQIKLAKDKKNILQSFLNNEIAEVENYLS